MWREDSQQKVNTIYNLNSLLGGVTKYGRWNLEWDGGNPKSEDHYCFNDDDHSRRQGHYSDYLKVKELLE